MRARESCRNDVEPAEGEKITILSKAGRAEASKPLDIRRGATGFGVCPAGSQSCFGSVFPHCDLTPPFWHGDLQCFSVCRMHVVCFLILQGITIRRLL